jgi:dihydrodipicolinate synthase/N-acetylneuraminate lyase
MSRGTNRRLVGVAPVMVTPMQQDGEPDEAATHRLVDHLIKAGIGGIWAMGSASEDVNMSEQGRLNALRWLAQANAGRVPVLFGTGLVRIDDMLRFLDELEGLSFDGVHVLYMDPKQGDARMIAELSRLADRSEYPVWLYHNPKRGKPVSRAVITTLRDHPNIAGMKVGGYSLSEMVTAIRLQTPSFQVIGAGGGQMFTMFCLGAEAHTTSSASCWPEEYVKLHRLFVAGDHEGARQQQFRLIALEEQLPRTDNGEYAAEEKYILLLRGLCSEFVNTAYRCLTAEEKAKARAVVRTYGFDWAPADRKLEKCAFSD